MPRASRVQLARALRWRPPRMRLRGARQASRQARASGRPSAWSRRPSEARQARWMWRGARDALRAPRATAARPSRSPCARHVCRACVIAPPPAAQRPASPPAADARHTFCVTPDFAIEMPARVVRRGEGAYDAWILRPFSVSCCWRCSPSPSSSSRWRIRRVRRIRCSATTFTMPIWLPVALAAVLGVLLTLLTLSPAVGASRTNALEREHNLQR